MTSSRVRRRKAARRAPSCRSCRDDRWKSSRRRRPRTVIRSSCPIQKWGTLLNGLLEFKRDYNRNTPLAEVLPEIVNAHPEVYRLLGLRDLARQMFDQLRHSRQTHWLAEAFSTLPVPIMPPADAYQQLVTRFD